MPKIQDPQETSPKEFRCLCGSLMALIQKAGVTKLSIVTEPGAMDLSHVQSEPVGVLW